MAELLVVHPAESGRAAYGGLVGIASDLGYEHRRPNAFQRGMQALGSSKGGAWMFSRTLQPMDRAVRALSRGRASAPGLLAGLPVLWVTTTGRKSGQPRTAPLIAVPVGDDGLALLGTNFGQAGTPAWVLNLEADPALRVGFGGQERAAVARPATDVERDEVWSRSRGVYGGYEKYQERISGRTVRIFVLDPA